jgi:hypothetical protein
MLDEMASTGDLPSHRNWMATSMIMMPFFFDDADDGNDQKIHAGQPQRHQRAYHR